ncbi:hypothetical protein M6B38_101750 [Iris pallida]|uniref:Uncharacterized protein n=1 Tax=Iris pallida TaxID=29817 RepID=A0AAX6IMJ5_IRIPA|nr:hypothetical protein M6B38_101750 [Iris pallida]
MFVERFYFGDDVSCLTLKLEFLCYCSAFDNFQMQTMLNKQIENLSTLLRKLQTKLCDLRN